MKTEKLTASCIDKDKHEYVFELGRLVACGTVDLDNASGEPAYSLLHAPSQAGFDAIAAALDALSDEEIVRLVREAEE